MPASETQEFSNEHKAHIAEVLKAKTLEAISLAEKLAMATGPVSPPIAALALRIAAEHAEYEVRKLAGEEVFEAYRQWRNEVVKAADTTTEKHLKQVRS